MEGIQVKRKPSKRTGMRLSERDRQRGFTDDDLQAALAYVDALRHPDVAEVAVAAPDNFLKLCQENPEFENLVKAHASDPK